MIPTLEAVSALLIDLTSAKLQFVLHVLPPTTGTLITKLARAALNTTTGITVQTNVSAALLDIPLTLLLLSALEVLLKYLPLLHPLKLPALEMLPSSTESNVLNALMIFQSGTVVNVLHALLKPTTTSTLRHALFVLKDWSTMQDAENVWFKLDLDRYSNCKNH